MSTQTTTNSAGIPVTALKAHIGINVSDVETSIGFYRSLFGIEPSKVRRGYAKFDVANPPLNFTLNQNPVGTRGALSHMGIQVKSTEDVIAVRDRWIEAGLVARDEVGTDCCYAIQDKSWVSDPDGNEWEVFTVLKDQLPESTSGAGCCPAPSTGESTCSTSPSPSCTTNK